MKVSRFFVFLCFALLSSIFSLVVTAYANILSGNYSYDSQTDLYTYSYSLDNTSGPATIDDLSILINSSQQDGSLSPVSHTDPVSWNFFTSISGSSGNPPLNEFGTFWEWYGSGLPVGYTLSGFSFTTDIAPTSSSANNYFIYSFTYSGGPIGNEGVVEYGHIVAPDFGSSIVPEPISSILFITGGTLLAGRRYLKKRRAV